MKTVPLLVAVLFLSTLAVFGAPPTAQEVLAKAQARATAEQKQSSSISARRGADGASGWTPFWMRLTSNRSSKSISFL
jgi:hypothetical protein